MTVTKIPRPVTICNCGDHAWKVLTRGYVTLVSIEDAHFLDEPWHTWTSRGVPTYAGYRRGNRALLLHRSICPNLKQIDHKNTNGFDNRRKNLRECNHSNNQANSNLKKKRFRGICRNYKKWSASIKVNKIKIYLGSHDTEEAAAMAYDAAAIKHFGEFAKLNFPQP